MKDEEERMPEGTPNTDDGNRADNANEKNKPGGQAGNQGGGASESGNHKK